MQTKITQQEFKNKNEKTIFDYVYVNNLLCHTLQFALCSENNSSFHTNSETGEQRTMGARMHFEHF